MNGESEPTADLTVKITKNAISTLDQAASCFRRALRDKVIARVKESGHPVQNPNQGPDETDMIHLVQLSDVEEILQELAACAESARELFAE